MGKRGPQPAPELRRDVEIKVRVRRLELERLQAAADRAGVPLARWMREIALKVAGDEVAGDAR